VGAAAGRPGPEGAGPQGHPLPLPLGRHQGGTASHGGGPGQADGFGSAPRCPPSRGAFASPRLPAARYVASCNSVIHTRQRSRNRRAGENSARSNPFFFTGLDPIYRPSRQKSTGFQNLDQADSTEFRRYSTNVAGFVNPAQGHR
jgi:hypothetical protein